jgi:hypothetical protein
MQPDLPAEYAVSAGVFCCQFMDVEGDAATAGNVCIAETTEEP